MYFNSLEIKDVKQIEYHLDNFLKNERKYNKNKMRFIFTFDEKNCKINGLLLQNSTKSYSKKIIKKAIQNLTENNPKISLEEINDTCWHLLYDK